MQEPTFSDVLRARRVLKSHLPPTPLRRYPALDRLLDARVWVKHENHQPTGAFKVRGGIYLLSLLAAELPQGVVSASTGNHGQSIAWAARLFGVRATIFAPEGANPVKVEAMEDLGAEVVLGGRDFEAAKARCEEVARQEGRRFISSGDEPDLVAGVGTYCLEILEELPEAETILVPIGGGSGAAGTCVVAKTLSDHTRVVGVQAAAAPAAYLTWKRRQATTARLETEAEGLATGAPFMLPQQILWRHLDEFLLVEEEAMRQAVRLYLEKARTLAEPAGAAPLAAALAHPEEVRGRNVVLVLSGGNIAPEQLRRCLSPR